MNEYENCTVCSRNCGVDRTKGKKGFCGQSRRIKLAWAGIHFGEEPPLTGRGGSGTVFFSGCTMKCSFCQNWQISHRGNGKYVSKDTFFRICSELKERGAENINFVTGSHFIPTLVPWMKELKEKGINIPLVWNYSGLEKTEYLEKLRDAADIFLPDLKTLNEETAELYFGYRKYPSEVKESLKFAVRGKPLRFTSSGIMVSGTIVRHLALPGRVKDTLEVIKWFSDNLKERALLSIMTQYTPVRIPGNRHPVPAGYLSKGEFEEILLALDRFGIEEGFIQEPEHDDAWLPDFTKPKPFPSMQSVPVWSFREGFTKP